MSYSTEYIFSLRNHDITFCDFGPVEKKINSINSALSTLSNKNNKRITTGGKNTPNISRNYNYNNKHHNNSNENGWRTVNKEKYKSRFNSDNNNDFMKIKINEILNKLSNSNFETIKNDLKNLLEVNNNNYDEFAVEMLYANSLQQPLFCKQYVNMLSVIKHKEYVNNKYDKYYEYVSNSDEDLIHKKGYTSFIVEMYNTHVITKDKLTIIALNMLDEINSNNNSLEKYVEHLLIIFKNSNDKNFLNDKKKFYMNIITKLSKDKNIPSMIRFKLMSIITELE